MMETNLGIEFEANDDLVIPIHEDDTELGLLGSSVNLLQNPESRKPSLHSSLKSSVIASIKKTKTATWSLLKTLRKILLSMKLAIIVALYSLIGALVFMELEKQNDLESKAAARDYHLIARNIFLNSLKLIEQEYDDMEMREVHWNQSIEEFETNIGASLPEIETSWTFSMAILYAGTIYTTIEDDLDVENRKDIEGYGNIACVTTSGRIATIIYAMIGIPLMIIVLNTLNKVFLVKIRTLTSTCSDILLYIGVRLGIKRLQQGSREFIRYQIISKRYSKRKNGSNVDIENQEYNINKDKDANYNREGEDEEEPPVLPSVIATLMWIFLSAAIFCIWEDWTYFTSIYFFFVSLSTIGFGDITPGHPEYMMATFGVVIIGLALLGVCIDVVREKLERMYMILLQKLLQEYIDRAASGDHDGATRGMMSGFQDKTKFLRPFVSKEQSAKIMDKFKEKAKEQGIEIPAVLTDIDPETGAPAFVNAKTEDFSEYIEKAKTKEENQALKPIMVQTEGNVQYPSKATSNSTGTQFSSPISANDLLKMDYSVLKKIIAVVGPQYFHKGMETSTLVFPRETQTKTLGEYLASNSINIQASPAYYDVQSQTLEIESMNSAIQVCSFMDNKSTQMDTEKSEESTQYDHDEVFFQDIAIQNCDPVVNRGTQPEVSSLILLDYDDDSNDDLTFENDEGYAPRLLVNKPESVITKSEHNMIPQLQGKLAAKVVNLENTPLSILGTDSLQETYLQSEEAQPITIETTEKQLNIDTRIIAAHKNRKDTISIYLRNRGNQTKTKLTAEEMKFEIARLRFSLLKVAGVDADVETEKTQSTVKLGTQVTMETTEEIQTDISCFRHVIKADLSVQDNFLKDFSSQTEVCQSNKKLQTPFAEENKMIQTASYGYGKELLFDCFSQTDVSAFDMIFDRPTQTDVSAFDMLFEHPTQTEFSIFTCLLEVSTQTQLALMLDLDDFSSQTDFWASNLSVEEQSIENLAEGNKPHLKSLLGTQNENIVKNRSNQTENTGFEDGGQYSPTLSFKASQTGKRNATILSQTTISAGKVYGETQNGLQSQSIQTESFQKVALAIVDNSTEKRLEMKSASAQIKYVCVESNIETDVETVNTAVQVVKPEGKRAINSDENKRKNYEKSKGKQRAITLSQTVTVSSDRTKNGNDS